MSGYLPDRESALKVVKAVLQPHYTAKRITKEEFVELSKAGLQSVLDAPRYTHGWTAEGIKQQMEARLELLLGGEGAAILHTQQSRHSTPLKGTVEAHRAALASIRGHMVRVLGRADVDDGDDAWTTQAPTVVLAGPRRASNASAQSTDGFSGDNPSSSAPSALSPPFRPRRSPSATPVTPRSAVMTRTTTTAPANIVHVPPALESPARPSTATMESERMRLLHQMEVLELREASSRQSVELDETRHWQSTIAMPFVTRAASLMIAQATRTNVVAPPAAVATALAPQPSSGRAAPPLAAAGLDYRSATTPSQQQQQFDPHSSHMDVSGAVTNRLSEDEQVQELYAQLQAKQRALRNVVLHEEPNNRDHAQYATQTFRHEEHLQRRHEVTERRASPRAHMSPVPPNATTPRRRPASPRAALMSPASKHLTPARRGAPLGPSRPSRAEVVDFMRRVLQPYYNEGRLPQSAFVAIVKSVSTDFFGPGHDWRSGTVAADRAWQAYLEERLELCVAKLEHRHTGL